tara:strand:+ start:3395 stop:3865 length:471 start_codon:yes stop_codon:yes gene_type:complete
MSELKKCSLEQAIAYTPHDPVRPNIPANWRVSGANEMYYTNGSWGEIDKPNAVLCMSNLKAIPKDESELMSLGFGEIAIFYTVWSNVKGAGRDIIFKVWDMLKERKTNRRYVTLSPKTEMAKKFHLSNGAKLIATNDTTYNFEYGAVTLEEVRGWM